MKGRYGVHSIPYGDMGHFDGTLQQCNDFAPEMEKAAEERFQKDIQHAIEMGMSEEKMNQILHDTYSRRGKYIPSISNGNVSWNEKQIKESVDSIEQQIMNYGLERIDGWNCGYDSKNQSLYADCGSDYFEIPYDVNKSVQANVEDLATEIWRRDEQ